MSGKSTTGNAILYVMRNEKRVNFFLKGSTLFIDVVFLLNTFLFLFFLFCFSIQATNNRNRGSIYTLFKHTVYRNTLNEHGERIGECLTKKHVSQNKENNIIQFKTGLPKLQVFQTTVHPIIRALSGVGNYISESSTRFI